MDHGTSLLLKLGAEPLRIGFIRLCYLSLPAPSRQLVSQDCREPANLGAGVLESLPKLVRKVS